MSGNTRFAVAVHVLAILGRLEQEGVELVPSSQIARSVNTNAVVIRTLLRTLKKAGLVHSKEGRGGGVKLAKSSSRISLQEIYEAVETDGIFAASEKPQYAPCPVSCGMKKLFLTVTDEVDEAVAKVLRRKTLKQMLDRL